MNAQTLLKLLAFLSLAITAGAAGIWYTTESPPPGWVLQVSLAFFAAAMIVGLFGAETRPRLVLRFLAALFALVAVVALVADYSRPGETASTSTAFLDHIAQFSPSLVTSLEGRITRTLGATAWDPFLKSLFSIPTYLIFGALTFLCGYAGRPRKRLSVFVN